jgi:hypothetical protein
MPSVDFALTQRFSRSQKGSSGMVLLSHLILFLCEDYRFYSDVSLFNGSGEKLLFLPVTHGG